MCIYIQKCYYVFFNVCKASSYIIGTLIASSLNGILHRTFVIELQLYCERRCFAKQTIFVFFSFCQINIRHKILHVETNAA